MKQIWQKKTTKLDLISTKHLKPYYHVVVPFNPMTKTYLRKLSALTATHKAQTGTNRGTPSTRCSPKVASATLSLSLLKCQRTRSHYNTGSCDHLLLLIINTTSV